MLDLSREGKSPSRAVVLRDAAFCPPGLRCVFCVLHGKCVRTNHSQALPTPNVSGFVSPDRGRRRRGPRRSPVNPPTMRGCTELVGIDGSSLSYQLCFPAKRSLWLSQRSTQYSSSFVLSSPSVTLSLSVEVVFVLDLSLFSLQHHPAGCLPVP